MLDSKALASIPLIPANTAPPAPDYPWPKPYTSAMFLSFDVDAESAWTSKDAAHAQRLITMSYGGYEARVGTPKLLELLEQLDLKATFFVTGWSVDAHPAMAEAILKAGHEIGHHGYHHLLPDPGDPWIEEEVERGFEALKRRLGVKPTGYRAPYGEFTE
jgi:peptidoglycan/xylan/chitin deacetylase (PgdA/CDA1 family)